MKLDLESIKKLSENLNKYNLNEATIETKEMKLTIKKEIPTEEVTYKEIIKTPKDLREELQEREEAKIEEISSNFEPLASPIVGTFYRSPAPGAEPFVTEGQEVKVGDTLCIVEAMKLMNEVKATKNCKIEKIVAEEGKVVKKGDPLFLIS
ncbi:MAG: acetyl-CoA carboxylase biotin carboxyl carrier protein [Fusobacteriaceae bacterium]